MLKNIKLKNFRSFETAEFDLSAPSTVFSGANGRGKTSVLEAVYYVSTLRSFRTSKIRELRRIGSKGFELRLAMDRGGRWNRELKVEDLTERRLFFDNVPVRRASEFADSFKCVVFLPDDPVILTGSPVFRRRFLDMFICMMERTYFSALQRYAAALKNRNFLLKTRRVDRAMLSTYASILANDGSYIVRERVELLSLLEKKVRLVLSAIRPELQNLTLVSRHSPDTLEAGRFLDKLERSVEKDMERSMTLTGPHVDDFDVLCDGKSLRYYGSRGQCRMVSLALKLAEFELVSEMEDEVVVLVDDAVGDLDHRARESFISRLKSAKQILYAFTELPDENWFDGANQIVLN